VTLGSATVLAIYAAGFMRTRAAANRVESASQARRQAAHEVSAPPEIATPQMAPAETSVAAVVSPDTNRHEKAPVRAETSKAAPVVVATQTPAPAEAPVPTPVAPVAPAAPSPVPADTVAAQRADSARVAWKDGSYAGWGTSRHGDIEATVEIKNGRIVSAFISQCRTRYSCSRIADLPPQVISRQSAEVDYVSGATQSSDAFYYGVVEALKKAK
jgi:uncharacterized protein with FMN-binding domain